MKLFTRPRVLKGYSVEVEIPRIIECSPDKFVKLAQQVSSLNYNESSCTAKEVCDDSLAEALTKDQSQTVVEDKRQEHTINNEEAASLASSIIAQAEKDSEEIRQKANAEIEQLRQEVFRKAEEEIYPQAEKRGYQEGYEKGLKEGREKADQIIAEAMEIKEEANRLWNLAQNAVQEEFAKVDEQLLKLALKISERIVRAQIKIKPELLLEQIRALALLPQERTGFTLHVSPADERWIQKLSLEDQPKMARVVDDTLVQGDCYLECEEGLFDARLQSQLDKFELFLQEELKHGSMGTAE